MLRRVWHRLPRRVQQTFESRLEFGLNTENKRRARRWRGWSLLADAERNPIDLKIFGTLIDGFEVGARSPIRCRVRHRWGFCRCWAIALPPGNDAKNPTRPR